MTYDWIRVQDWADEVTAPSIGNKCRDNYERLFGEKYRGQCEAEILLAELNN